MEKAKKTALIPLLPWGCLWMQTESLWLSISFLATKMNRRHSDLWKKRFSAILTAANLFSVRMRDLAVLEIVNLTVWETELTLSHIL